LKCLEVWLRLGQGLFSLVLSCSSSCATNPKSLRRQESWWVMTQQNKTPVRKTLCGGFALAIPFAAMLVMIGINALNLSTAEYRIKIRGYDPRDILRGHYLIFQYDWPFE